MVPIAPVPDHCLLFTFDARSGYLSIKLSEGSSFLTTFNTPNHDHYLHLPFCLTCSFSATVMKHLEGLEGLIAIVDNILVYNLSK